MTAVLVLVAAAVGDALRGGEGDGAPEAPPEETAPAELPGVPAPGSIVFLDRSGCALHHVVAASGRQRPLPRIETGCELWAAPRGGRVAFALRGPYNEFKPFRFLDLARPDERLGTFQTFLGVTWSADGRRAFWCHDPASGFELEVGREAEPRLVGRCPRAYTPDGRIARVESGRVVVGDRPVTAGGEFVSDAEWARDGSLALFVGDRVERRVNGRVEASVPLPPELIGRRPVLSPDGCAALYPLGGAVIRAVNVCHESDLGTFAGTEAAWSPDGRWIAVANDDAIEFHRVDGTPAFARWPVAAVRVAWVS